MILLLSCEKVHTQNQQLSTLVMSPKLNTVAGEGDYWTKINTSTVVTYTVAANCLVVHSIYQDS